MARGPKEWRPEKQWKKKYGPRIFVVLVGEYDDRYPLVFAGDGDRAAFSRAWDTALTKAAEKNPDEWNYDEVMDEMRPLGYEWLDREWIAGE